MHALARVAACASLIDNAIKIKIALGSQAVSYRSYFIRWIGNHLRTPKDAVALSHQQPDREPGEISQVGVEGDNLHPKSRGERDKERVAPSFVGRPRE